MTRLTSVFAVFSFIISLPALAFSTSSSGASSRPDDVALSIGRSVMWPVASSGAISVSNGAIIRVVDRGQTIKITALKLGAAVVKSGFRELQVNVIPETSYRVYSQLHDALENRRGLELSSATGALKVRGRLLRVEDWLALGAAASGLSAASYEFAASLEPEVEAAARLSFGEKLRAAGLSNVNLRFSPQAVATIGLEPKDALVRAEKILAPFGFRVEANTSVLTLEPLVRVKILVAEVKKSFERKFGVSWPDVIGGQLLPDQLFPTSPLEVGLNALEQNGWGRVLASPNLLCRSGKEAQFMAGGEFPIRVSSLRASDVVWKNYGVMLRVKPLADSTGRMSIEIETEVSSLDHSNTGAEVPGLLTNKMQTHFDLTRSRTIALSGLIKSDTGDDQKGLPGLSSIPILGSLFSSHDYNEHKSELVIFVTPEVLKPDDDALEKAP